VKELKHIITVVLLTGYAGVLWHNTVPIHNHEGHHHHPGGHHHGLVSIIVDIIHDLHHARADLESDEEFLVTDHKFTSKKFLTETSETWVAVNREIALPVGVARGIFKPQNTPHGAYLSLTTLNLTYRGPPSIS